jgi:hypothetical protein
MFISRKFLIQTEDAIVRYIDFNLIYDAYFDSFA